MVATVRVGDKGHWPWWHRTKPWDITLHVIDFIMQLGFASYNMIPCNYPSEAVVDSLWDQCKELEGILIFCLLHPCCVFTRQGLKKANIFSKCRIERILSWNQRKTCTNILIFCYRYTRGVSFNFWSDLCIQNKNLKIQHVFLFILSLFE